MLPVTFDLSRPAQVTFHNHAFRDAIHHGGGRIVLRPSRNHVFRRVTTIGHEKVGGRACAARAGGQRDGSAHEFQEAPPRGFVGGFAGSWNPGDLYEVGSFSFHTPITGGKWSNL